jgi:hypothetical protein
MCKCNTRSQLHDTINATITSTLTLTAQAKANAPTLTTTATLVTTTPLAATVDPIKLKIYKIYRIFHLFINLCLLLKYKELKQKQHQEKPLKIVGDIHQLEKSFGFET